MPESKMSKEVKIESLGIGALDVNKATGEIVKGYQKIADGNIEKLQEIQENALPPIISEKVQKKIAKTVNAVITAGMVASPFTLAACAKEVPVVEEKVEVTAPSEAIETAPSTTAAETVSPTTVTETAPETTAEIEKVDAPEIEGLKFDQETRRYINEAGAEVGIYVKNAIEINGKTEDAIGFTPGEIESRQNEIYKETKEYLCPIVFPLNEIKGIKIKEMDVETEIGEGYSFLGIELPPDTNFFIPASGKWLFLPGDNQSSTKTLVFRYDIGVKNALGGITMEFKRVDIVKDMKKREETLFNNENPEGIKTTIGDDTLKLGEVFGTIIGNDYLEIFNNELDYIKFKEPGLYQFELLLKKNDSPLKGVEKLFSIKKDDKKIKVFIFNSSEKLPNEQTN